MYKGIQANYAGKSKNGLGRGFLNADESITVEVDSQLKSDNKSDTMAAVVSSLSQSILSSYYEAVGLLRGLLLTKCGIYGTFKADECDSG